MTSKYACSEVNVKLKRHSDKLTSQKDIDHKITRHT